MKKIPNPEKMRRIRGPKLKVSDKASTKIRITTYVDQDVLKLIKGMAHDSGSKYQTVLNQILRDYLLGQKEGLVARITNLEKAVSAINLRSIKL